LIDLLGEDRYRLLALKALAQIPHPDTLDPFCAATNDPSPAIRAIAITALGNVSRDDLMPIFLQALQDPDPKVRQAAVTALGVRNSARWQLVPHLTPLLADPFSTVAEQAAIALGRIGTIEAADALFPVLKSLATPPSLKLTLVRSLGWMTHPKALHYLGIALHWCDHPICIAIIQALATQEQPELRAIATQILLEFLTAAQHHSQDPAIRQQTALALGELGDPTALSYLETLAQDPNLQIRLHAQAALRKVLATPSPP
jgi:HEAT repeat protein